MFADRGFTAHEHLEDFDLINMNGRLYDPVVARMLSPDAFVQNAGSTQNFNRYSYCLNNPLKYTDPSGNKYHYIEQVQWVPGAEAFAGGSGRGGGGSGSLFPKMGYFNSPRNNFEYDYMEGMNFDRQLGYGAYMDKLLDDVNDGRYNKKDVERSGLLKYEWVSRPNYGTEIKVNGDNGNYTLNWGGGGIISRKVYYNNGNTNTNNSYLYFAAWSILNKSTGALANTLVDGYNITQATLNANNGINSILVNKRIASWANIGQTTKFLGFAGNIAGMIPTTLDIRANGLNGENLLDGIIGASSFVPVFGWALSPTFSWYTNDVRNDPNIERRVESLEFQMMWHCFAEGTAVLMSDRSHKNIEYVQIGDSVLTYNFVNKKLEVNTVQKVDTPVHHKLIKVVFGNKEEIVSTEDHPYYVKEKGWCSFNPEQTLKNYGIKTERLEPYDYCLTVKGKRLRKVKVIEITPFEKSIKTYNLSKIANSNNYFVNSILVNNESIEIPINNKKHLK